MQRVEFGEGAARYEPVIPGGEHHHHAVCDSCGRVTPFEDERLEKQLERLGGKPEALDERSRPRDPRGVPALRRELSRWTAS